MRLKQVKRLRGDLRVKMMLLRGLFSFLLNHAMRTLFWLLMSTALSFTYLYINYKATGEVKQEVLVFVTILLVLFSVSSHFRLGRTYIIVTTLNIIVQFTSRTHLLFIVTEVLRLELIFVENLRRVGQATNCYKDLYRSMLGNLIEREREKRASKVVLILDYIRATRERMAQALRAIVLHAQYMDRLIDQIKSNFVSIGLLKFLCKVVVPLFDGYCKNTSSAVYKDCLGKTGYLLLGSFIVCGILSGIHTVICDIFYAPFTFLCSFDKEVKAFLKEVLVGMGLQGMYQQLREEFRLKVDVEFRFNHTMETGGSSDIKDRSEIFEQVSKFIPSTDGTDAVSSLIFYLLTAMAFIKPAFDLWRFQKNLSFYNDCVDTKTFKKLDKKAPKDKRILPLTKTDKKYFRTSFYQLPPGSKKYRLLASVYWPSLTAIFLVMNATFFLALISIDTSFVSYMDLTKLTPESKIQLNEARFATRNYTMPGIFTKSAEDFYKSMKKFTDEDQDRARSFMGYAKKHKGCAPQLLTPNSSLLHTLYIWTGIVFTCNTLGLVLRLVYGKLLEHFFHKYKPDRARDLMDRIKLKRSQLVARMKQLMAMAKSKDAEKLKDMGTRKFIEKMEGREKKGKKKRGKGKKKGKKKKKDEKKKDKKEDKKKKDKKKEDKRKKDQKKKDQKKKKKKPAKKKPAKKKPGKKGKKVGAGMSDGVKSMGFGAWPSDTSRGGMFFMASKDKASKPNIFKRFWRKLKKWWRKLKKWWRKLKGLWRPFLGKLFPNMRLFYFEKFVCTQCKKTTKYKDLQECAQPGCGAALCQACAHKCLEGNHGKCPDCGYPFILDTYLEFPLQPSPTRSLCEVDLEPWYIDPEVRFSWMKPLTLCTACRKHYVLNHLQERCILCRKGGIRDFDPKKYEGPTRKPGEPYAHVHVPGFDFLDSARAAQDKHPVFY